MRVLSRSSNLVKPDQKTSCGYRATHPGPSTRVQLNRHPPHHRRGQNRNAFQQDILFMVFCEHEHLGVRMSPLLLLRFAKLYDLARFIVSPREPWAR